MYKNLAECVRDLAKTGQLHCIDLEIDPRLEVAAIQRRALALKAPALLFTNVKGSKFPMLANMFGTRDRLRFIFRDSLRQVESLFKLAADPADLWKHFRKHWRLGLTVRHAFPAKVSHGPILDEICSIADLPQLISWPKDGGAFITLPQVYTECPGKPGWMNSNLGMYRIQLSGGAYAQDEVGLHYQIHRGIGYHHAEALRCGVPLPVNIFIGGPPAMTLSAILPTPEGIPELAFAGLLAGFRIPMIHKKAHLPILAEADFCISGEISPYLKKEGPFGDHLGYYSLAHDFPVLKVNRVYHRKNAIWPFTSVGRPPQEDTMFGEIIHELTGPLIERMFPGVHQIHAVDAAGVHPLLLALGSERYVPFTPQEDRLPQELLTCGLSLLGRTQTSLSKFVLLAAKEDNPSLNVYDVPRFFQYMLERTRFDRDLHFITKTTMDTLDYSGISLNQGSKLLWTAAGPKIRELGTAVPSLIQFPAGYGRPRMLAPGILVIEGPRHTLIRNVQDPALKTIAAMLKNFSRKDDWPLLVVADDSDFATASWDNFLWVTFTRSDPATDISGVNAASENKHWGCATPLIIDARLKSHHAPPLEPDPAVERKIDALAAPGQPLYGLC